MAHHQPKVTEKPCAHCGKPIHWTRNTATIWESILYCDNACKRQANRQLPRHLDENANLKGPAISRSAAKANPKGNAKRHILALLFCLIPAFGWAQACVTMPAATTAPAINLPAPHAAPTINLPTAASAPVDCTTSPSDAPQVVKVYSLSPDGTYTQGQTIQLAVKLNTPVNIFPGGGSSLALAGGYVAYIDDGSHTDPSVSYATDTVIYNVSLFGGNVAHLDYASVNSLDPSYFQTADGHIISSLPLPAPGSANSLGGQSNITIIGIQ